MGKVLALILTALGAGLLLYWLFAPRNSTPNPVASPSSATSTVPASSQGNGNQKSRNTDEFQRPNALTPQRHTPIEPPRTPQQRDLDDLEAKRGSFYAAMHQNGEALLAAFQPSPEDPATLDLYAHRDDSQMVLQLLTLVSRADAFHYGFRHIRFFLPNPPNTVERYRLEAEATPDANGAWQAFQK